MLLFVTRDAFLRFSIEDLRVGEGDALRIGTFSTSNRAGEIDSRCFQKERGEELLAGEGSNGDESLAKGDFCDCRTHEQWLMQAILGNPYLRCLIMAW